MIPIFKKTQPKELLEYKKNNDEDTWDYKNLTEGVKPAIQKSLCEEQGFICAYCMQRIEPNGQQMKIEHWITQATSKKDSVDYSNMLGCCLGQYKDVSHCDTYRGHLKKEKQQLKYNPANSQHHSLLGIGYKPDGKIFSSDEEFNSQLSDVLNLNDDKYLCEKRKKIISGIVETIQKLKSANIPYDIANMITNWKKKDDDGKYKEFYGVAVYFLNGLK